MPLWIWNPDASETVVLVHGWEGRGAQLGAFVALLAVVELLGGEVHAVIGHSVGGAAALLATRLGLRAKRLALIAPPTSPARFAAGFAQILGIDARVHAGMLLRLERRYGIAVADLDVRRDGRRAAPHVHRDARRRAVLPRFASVIQSIAKTKLSISKLPSSPVESMLDAPR